MPLNYLLLLHIVAPALLFVIENLVQISMIRSVPYDMLRNQALYTAKAAMKAMSLQISPFGLEPSYHKAALALAGLHVIYVRQWRCSVST